MGCGSLRRAVRLVAKLKRRIQLHERRVSSRLSPAEREQLLGLLEKLVG